MLVEMLFLSVVFLSGATLLLATGLRGFGVLPLGYLAGLFTWVLVGVAFAVTGLPTAPPVLIFVLALISLVVFFGFRSMALCRSRDYALIAAGVLTLLLMVCTLWQVGHVKYHIDTFRYLLVSGLLAENHFDLMNANLLTKRMLGAPLLHLPASMYESSHVVALTPLVGLSILGGMGWFLWRIRPEGLSKGALAVIIVLVVLLLATNNRFIWNSFYVNAHLFFGSAFMVLVAGLWLYAYQRAKGEGQFLLVLSCLAIPSLIVSRPEGFIAAALAILPFVLSRGVGKTERSIVALVYLLSTLVWFGYVAWALAGMGRDVPLAVLGPVLLSVIGILVLPLLWLDRWMQWRVMLLRAVEVALWIMLGLLSIRNTEIMTDSLAATWENLVLGAGSWGASVLLLLAILAYVFWALRRHVPIELRFPVTAMVPVFFLLAHIRGAAYRVGNGDSLNRMLIEVVPLAVLLVGIAMVMYWTAPPVSTGSEDLTDSGNDKEKGV